MSANEAEENRERHIEAQVVLTAGGVGRVCGLRFFVALAVCLGLQAGAGTANAQTSPSPGAASPSKTSPDAGSQTGSSPNAAPAGAASTSGVAPSPAPPPGIKPSAPSAADAADPTPEHVEKARQLILATGISRSFQIIIPEFMAQIGNSLTQSRPELIDDMNKVLEQLRPEFDRQSDEMIDQSARIYAKLLSEKDIDAVLAFFNSEAGRKYVGAQPLFLNQLVSGMQAWQQKISATMLARVREEMKKKGHNL